MRPALRIHVLICVRIRLFFISDFYSCIIYNEHSDRKTLATNIEEMEMNGWSS